ncbi:MULTISPECIES: HAD family phosphatase [unclassified Gemella]|uniref:HAD family hydrolase n=1 Tax=unclassified Gemella TaxID=2624949 RepID=UPI001073E072|nr:MULTISPECIES: HAD family phosphatase [unclassified Gemella]MBF0709931.1 HAD family phosphatase [Gemella sp. GL1.1]MBF0746765.1 HAD family phosphatase [Gemella sp. 19428wG2_WT2a]NYS27275.1 HAD family phosphatase [Gemella sp. GL1]TFU59490.1 HAD family phosphatase [Gemella sp. WT2a]
MRELEAVIFDYDGTLVDTEETYYEVMEYLVKKYTGKQLEKLSYIRNVSGTSVEQCKKYITETFSMTDEEYDVLEDELREGMGEKLKRSALLPYIKEVFELLKENSIKIGIASNGLKKHIESGLKYHGLYELVDDIVTKYDVDRAKPAPDIYLKSADRLGVNIKNCVAVEDSKPGATAAAASGAYLILQTNSITKHIDFSGVKYKERDVNLYERIESFLKGGIENV